MTPIKKATRLADFRNSFRLTPLAVEEMAFRKETKKSRGGSPSSLDSLKREWMEEDNTSYDHVLYIGYKGCGKSTELNFFQSQICDKYLVINFSVHKELNPLSSISPMELFVVMMEKLFGEAEKYKLEINPAYLKKIQRWLSTTELQEVNEKYIGAELETGLEAGITLPFLTKFFGRFKAAAKASTQLKETLKTSLEPKLPELVELCNDFIREIRSKKHHHRKEDIVFILEDMDKLDTRAVEDIFYKYAVQLDSISAKTIFTFPISLYYYARFAQIKSYFSHIIELPMIKIFEKDGKTRNEAGFNALRTMIESRAELSLIKMDGDKFIEKCGGCIRDLFYMLLTAANNALNEDKDCIEEEDFQTAYLLLKKDYEAQIAEYREEVLKKDGQSEIIIHYPNQFYEDLAKLANSTDKKPENTNRILLLRQNLSILGYNGEGWCEVHPVLRDTLREKGLLNS